MPPEAKALLWDAHRAGRLIQQFVQERTWTEYERDAMLRSAVERQFEIIGEALNRLSKVDPSLAGEFEELPRLVAFRNLLIHGYATVDDTIVWELATTRLDPLVERLARWLEG